MRKVNLFDVPWWQLLLFMVVIQGAALAGHYLLGHHQCP